jgi:hypothetical protein
VTATRTPLFDLHSKLELTFGGFFAWCAVNTALFPVCFWFMGWMTKKGKAKEKGGGGAEREGFVALVRGWRLKVCEGWMVLYTLRGGAIVGALGFCV